ncbi:MAG: TIGR03617 family F420-dependent LLM class oxidoreductase [Anaerolineae bacterium]
MRIDTGLVADNLRDAPRMARVAEEIGFDALWSSETQHDPFLPLALAAEHTERIELGTAIAVAFARNPMSTAYIAWDLAKMSQGRLILGLGTQVKAHIERRFSMAWDSPAPRLREFILALRAIWDTWQNGSRLNFRGDFYQHKLMSPFFNPGPIDHPDIPIYIAGINEHLCRLAGELCEGFHVHPLHSAKYLEEFILPNIQRGMDNAGRTRAEIQLVAPVFVITGTNQAETDQVREEVRAQISFYASTPSYRPVFACHGWEDVAERLSRLAARGKWMEMPTLVTDDMLSVFAVEGEWDELPSKIMTRYDGLLDRVMYYYLGQRPEIEPASWRSVVAAFHEV